MQVLYVNKSKYRKPKSVLGSVFRVLLEAIAVIWILGFVCVICLVLIFEFVIPSPSFWNIVIANVIMAPVVCCMVLDMDYFWWLFRGEETISYDSEKLVIERKKLLRRTIVVDWKSMLTVECHEDSLFRSFLFYLLRIDGIEDKVKIWYGDHKTVRFGINLEKPQLLVDKIVELQSFYQLQK